MGEGMINFDQIKCRLVAPDRLYPFQPTPLPSQEYSIVSTHSKHCLNCLKRRISVVMVISDKLLKSEVIIAGPPKYFMSAEVDPIQCPPSIDRVLLVLIIMVVTRVYIA